MASNGMEANGDSYQISISADGRYVAFSSGASNLVAGDTNGWADIFVHDSETGQTTRVSVAFNGEQANDYSQYPSLSGDGRYVAFHTSASNLVPNDTNSATDVFVHDRVTGQTTRISSAVWVDGPNNQSSIPAISADGRYVAFTSHAYNLNNPA